MRNMLAFLAAVVLVLIGVGWYLDWFKFSVAPDGDGHQKVTIDVDTKKAVSETSSGLSTAGKKVEEFIEKEKPSTAKTDGSSLNINSDGKNVEVKTKSLDVAVPVKDFQFPQPK